MWKEGREPIGSMGDDTPAAALSDIPRPLFHYFKQRFAEVTNPPIDSLREEMVMSLSQRLGCRGSLLAETPEAARLLELPSPILSDADLAAIWDLQAAETDLGPDLPSDRLLRRKARQAAARFNHLRPATLDCTWPITEGVTGLRRAVARVCAQAVSAVFAGHTLLILSDRAVSAGRAPIPSLLAVSAVHHHLIEAGERMHASLIVESGEPREVHHFAALLSYGANAINPWLAFQAITDGLQEGGRHTEGLAPADAEHNFVKAVEKGILKIMSKMGIATVDAYCGAQIFEALGIGDELIRGAFAGTENFKLGGITYEDLARDVLAWHRNGYPKSHAAEPKLDSYGFYKSRRGGEQHAYSPEVVRAIHEVVGLAKGQGSGIRDQETGIRRQGSGSGNQRISESANQRMAHTQYPIPNTQYPFPPHPLVGRLPGLRRPGREAPADRVARSARAGAGGPAAGAAGRGRACDGDPAPVFDRGDVARRAERGGARGADHRHEPAGRRRQQRRGRRGRGALRHRVEQQDQTGRLGALRRHARRI